MLHRIAAALAVAAVAGFLAAGPAAAANPCLSGVTEAIGKPLSPDSLSLVGNSVNNTYTCLYDGQAFEVSGGSHVSL